MKVAREPVVQAGLKLLNEVGLEGLTLRGIAAELGVKAPSLYWRFKSKQDLIDEMATEVLAGLVPGLVNDGPPKGWRAGCLNFSLALRAALLRYRDGARMVGGSHMRDGSLYQPMERILEAFQGEGIAPSDATACLGTVYSYVIGFTLEQQAVLSPTGERDPRYALEAREQRVDAERFPLTRSIGADLFDGYDERFERGVRMIVDGFAASLARPDQRPK
ncbi:TetR/AcrR family transcriptional regulator C-terminal domain-containing protein [Dyella sp. GSA-30]|uniref:TetR/AcrR family transcriptional regulator C-terminal domain-containing protein n=1 Tax=Dyella sp. GSA-30 TaxID=2994496 RepID=UPI0024913383|nr:TetR/AcrR family transcriptional regulator C-terminal domain-containing protein [Dyella sp. GSA-30]BDU20862.1 TetR family transcriptional regulator [Dyella sp. GSA-30]